ncbi:MAG: hypothetical protein JXA13_00370 [Anaerolineales bacterium]|nr:hypothetical protein [Anaerolineales bacterium]
MLKQTKSVRLHNHWESSKLVHAGSKGVRSYNRNKSTPTRPFHRMPAVPSGAPMGRHDYDSVSYNFYRTSRTSKL